MVLLCLQTKITQCQPEMPEHQQATGLSTTESDKSATSTSKLATGSSMTESEQSPKMKGTTKFTVSTSHSKAD